MIIIFQELFMGWGMVSGDFEKNPSKKMLKKLQALEEITKRNRL